MEVIVNLSFQDHDIKCLWDISYNKKKKDFKFFKHTQEDSIMVRGREDSMIFFHEPVTWFYSDQNMENLILSAFLPTSTLDISTNKR